MLETHTPHRRRMACSEWFIEALDCGVRVARRISVIKQRLSKRPHALINSPLPPSSRRSAARAEALFSISRIPSSHDLPCIRRCGCRMMRMTTPLPTPSQIAGKKGLRRRFVQRGAVFAPPNDRSVPDSGQHILE